MEDTIICRCENVTLKHILETVEKYDSSVRETKLRTRAEWDFAVVEHVKIILIKL